MRFAGSLAAALAHVLVASSALAQDAPGSAEAPAPSPEPHRRVLEGALKAELRGVFVVNMWYSDGTLYPGGVAYFALPLAVSQPQFGISPSNTVVGFKLS